MDSHDMFTLAASVVSTAFVAGTLWGITKNQTRMLGEWLGKLEERIRHHVESEHPKLEDKIHSAQIDVAVVKNRTQSQVDRDEHRRG